MARFRLSPSAEADIEAILAWSDEQFGEQGRLSYEELLARAILDVAESPTRAGSMARTELASGAFTYHLLHSRDRVDLRVGRVKKPRHLLLYRFTGTERLEIGRVLHDSMDLARHLPPGYQSADRSE